MHLRAHGTALFTKFPLRSPRRYRGVCAPTAPCLWLKLPPGLRAATEGPQSTVHERKGQQERARNIQTSNAHVCLTA